MTPLPTSDWLLDPPLHHYLVCPDPWEHYLHALGHFYHLTFWVTCCHMNCKLFTRLTSPLSSVCGGSAEHTPSLTATRHNNTAANKPVIASYQYITQYTTVNRMINQNKWISEFISLKSVVAIMFLDNLILTSSQFKCFVLFGQKRSFAANKKSNKI